MPVLEPDSAFSLRDRIEEFKQFQMFGLAYQHGIKFQRPPRTLYTSHATGTYFPRRATTFIYAYFVFNAMYVIDWASSMAQHESEPVEWRVRLSEQEKIWGMAKFCLAENYTDPFSFTNKLVKYCTTFGVDDPIGELAKITERRNEYLTAKLDNQYRARRGNGDEISLRSINDFRNSFGALYKNGQSAASVPLENALVHINNVLYFVYLVRCSVFHGRKQLTIPEIREDQDVRLAIYAAVLMAMCQGVIERAEQEIARRVHAEGNHSTRS